MSPYSAIGQHRVYRNSSAEPLRVRFDWNGQERPLAMYDESPTEDDMEEQERAGRGWTLGF